MTCVSCQTSRLPIASQIRRPVVATSTAAARDRISQPGALRLAGIANHPKPQRLLTANAIAARLNTSQLVSISANPQVMRIEASHPYEIIPALATPFFPTLPASNVTSQPETVEWNILKIRADQAWSTFNITGTGAVVGIVDTGVMLPRRLGPILSWNLGGGNFDHNYSWFGIPFTIRQPRMMIMGHRHIWRGHY